MIAEKRFLWYTFFGSFPPIKKPKGWKSLKIQSLREFLTLSEVKNFNSAAERLFLSQPTISRHIKELEDELGVTLFSRSTRRVELTEYGKYFIPYAQRIVSAENEYIQGLTAMRKARSDE